MANKIQIKRGLKKNVPILSEGELGFCTDTKEVFIGTNNGNITVNDGNRNATSLDGKTAGYLANKDFIPVVGGGVMEIGKIIDFHEPGSTKDFEGRLSVVNKYPYWQLEGGAMSRISLADGNLQTNLNADLLDGRKSESYFSILGEVKNVKDLSNKFGFGYIQPTTEGMPLRGHWWMVSILYGFIGAPGRLIEVTSLSVPNEKYILRYDGATWSDWEKENIVKSIYVPTNSDLNNYVNEGFYFNHSNAEVANIKNAPVAESFALTVERHAGVSQTIKTYDPNNPRIFYRVFYAGNWSKWKECSNKTFLSRGFGNGGEISRQITGDCLNVKDGGIYVNQTFTGFDMKNAPSTGQWYHYNQYVITDKYVVLIAIPATEGKPCVRRKVEGVWGEWEKIGGEKMFTVPRQFNISNPIAGQTVFSYSGGPGEVLTTTNFQPILILDGVEFDYSFYPFSGNGSTVATNINIKFKNSITIKSRNNAASYNAMGIIMTEK